MTLLLDAEISGSNQYNFSGNMVQYMLVYLDVLGPDVRVTDLNNVDQIGFAGWLSLGSDSEYQGSPTRTYWNERIWINFQAFQWHPIPTVHAFDTPDFAVWASRIRWALSPGTHGFLQVIGI